MSEENQNQPPAQPAQPTDQERIAALESNLAVLRNQVQELPAKVCAVVEKTLDQELEAVVVAVCHKHAAEFFCAGVTATAVAPFKAIGRLFGIGRAPVQQPVQA